MTISAEPFETSEGSPWHSMALEDHLHLLAKLRPDTALSSVLRKLKANASGWMHRVFPRLEDFTWQRGYGAFTVSQSHVRKVSHYVARQKHTRRLLFEMSLFNS